MSFSCFIYYRVAEEARERVAREVSAMQARLREKSGFAGRLLHRADDPSTWLEIYEGVTDAPAFEATLAGLVRDCGIDRLLAAGEVRHVERFIPCA
jgi:hypothetical protein